MPGTIPDNQGQAAPKSLASSNQVIAASTGHMVHDIFTAFLPPLLPLIIAEFSLSMFEAGVLNVFAVLAFYFNPLLGMLVDRVNMRLLFVAAPGLVAVCMSLIGAAPSYWAVCLLLLFTGIGSAAYHTIGPVFITRASGSRLGRGMSFFMVGGEAARSLGPLAAVGALTWLGFGQMWPLMVVGLACSAYLWLVFRNATTVGGTGRDPESLIKVWRALRGLLLPLLGLVACRSFVLWSLMIYLPVYLVGRGYSVALGGAGLAVLELAGVGGAFLGGWLSDRWGRRPVLLAVMITAPLTMLAFNYSSGWLLWPLLALLGLCVFASNPVILALVQDHSAGRRGAANGLYMGMAFATSSGVLVLVGWLVDMLGFQTAFAIAACVGLAGAPFALRLPLASDR
ncbi:MAG: MFS transporter [Desulfarculaceae bacterium]|nr:MFS transporter [Desulfarculaceae bacterium]MCF8073785.1 MFS transporter [Desulfarculaceae bacterium]MCF8102026.1 MFS transporter [Desulfarculaceae bacterium]MCF8115996.1 MFS transporter [Desulfarculaceae bacterium]